MRKVDFMFEYLLTKEEVNAFRVSKFNRVGFVKEDIHDDTSIEKSVTGLMRKKDKRSKNILSLIYPKLNEQTYEKSTTRQMKKKS